MTREQVIAHLVPLEQDSAGNLIIRCKLLRVVIHVQSTGTPLIVGFNDGMKFRVTEKALVLEQDKPEGATRVLPWDEISSIVVGEPETTGGQLFQG